MSNTKTSPSENSRDFNSRTVLLRRSSKASGSLKKAEKRPDKIQITGTNASGTAK